jgi:hypothetical protein
MSMGNMSDLDMSDAEDLREGFKAVPPGDYQLYMESSERKTNKKETGEYLACVFVVAGGEYENSKIFCNFNLWNTNTEAVRIAKAQWRALCEAVLGQPNAINNDSASLHDNLFVAQVDNKPAYNKESGKNDHLTLRTNELVFRKGTLMSIKQYDTLMANVKDTPKVEPATQVPQQGQGIQVAPTVQPGQGSVPWNRSKK